MIKTSAMCISRPRSVVGTRARGLLLGIALGALALHITPASTSAQEQPQSKQSKQTKQQGKPSGQAPKRATAFDLDELARQPRLRAGVPRNGAGIARPQVGQAQPGSSAGQRAQEQPVSEALPVSVPVNLPDIPYQRPAGYSVKPEVQSQGRGGVDLPDIGDEAPSVLTPISWSVVPTPPASARRINVTDGEVAMARLLPPTSIFPTSAVMGWQPQPVAQPVAVVTAPSLADVPAESQPSGSGQRVDVVGLLETPAAELASAPTTMVVMAHEPPEATAPLAEAEMNSTPAPMELAPQPPAQADAIATDQSPVQMADALAGALAELEQTTTKTPAAKPAPKVVHVEPTQPPPAVVVGTQILPPPAPGTPLDPFTAKTEPITLQVQQLTGSAGMVQSLKGGSDAWKIVTLDDQGTGLYTLRTGPDAGCALIIDEQTSVRLGRLTRVELRAMASPENNGQRRIVVALTRGRVGIAPAAGQVVNVYTPQSLVVVREPIEVIHDTASGTRTLAYTESMPDSANVPTNP
jgi:hypothetical protein